MRRYNRKSLKVTVTPEALSPPSQLITLSRMKAYLKVDGTDDDDLINDLISAATVAAGDFMHRTILTTTYELVMDGFNINETDALDRLGPGVHTASKHHILGRPDVIELPMLPIISVTSVQTTDINNVETTFSSANYTLDPDGGRIYLDIGATWPTNLRSYNAVKVTYVAGYGSTDASVPQPIIEAVKTWVGKMYEVRGVCDCPKECKRLLDGYKLFDNLGFL